MEGVGEERGDGRGRIEYIITILLRVEMTNL